MFLLIELNRKSVMNFKAKHGAILTWIYDGWKVGKLTLVSKIFGFLFSFLKVALASVKLKKK